MKRHGRSSHMIGQQAKLDALGWLKSMEHHEIHGRFEPPKAGGGSGRRNKRSDNIYAGREYLISTYRDFLRWPAQTGWRPETCELGARPMIG